jgi:CheY-like chemotaxis protein
MKILWCEDKIEQIDRQRRLLIRDGHSVETAQTGETCLRKLRSAIKSEDPFDLLLLDIMLPRGEGSRINTMTKQKSMGAEVLLHVAADDMVAVVIGISAVADDELQDKLITKYSIVKSMLKKPVRIERLRSAISEAIAEHS